MSAKDEQIAGDHYLKKKIQPWAYALANELGPIETVVLKYITRWKDKGGIDDLRKARHALAFLIEHLEEEERNEAASL